MAQKYLDRIQGLHQLKLEHNVEKLRRMTGKSRIVCFGDNLNDLPMFRVADECYAVANAREELKSTATGVIGSNGECGVPAFIRSRAKAD